MFAKGGEFQASLQMGNGIDAQAAVSFSKHIGLIASYNFIDRNTTGDANTDDDDYLRHTFYEGGLGYFTNQEDMFFEVFAGYGRGEGFSSENFFGIENATGKYERYFIQPALGTNHKYIHLAFVPRISVVDFNEYSTSTASFAVNEDPKVFFEPAFVMKVNTASNRVFFTMQAGSSTALSKDVYFNRRKYQLAAGVGMRLGNLRPEQKESR